MRVLGDVLSLDNRQCSWPRPFIPFTSDADFSSTVKAHGKNTFRTSIPVKMTPTLLQNKEARHDGRMLAGRNL